MTIIDNFWQFEIVKIDSKSFDRIKLITSDYQPKIIQKISYILESIKPYNNIKKIIPSPESNDKYIIQNINYLIEDIRDLVNQNNKKANILLNYIDKINKEETDILENSVVENDIRNNMDFLFNNAGSNDLSKINSDLNKLVQEMKIKNNLNYEN